MSVFIEISQQYIEINALYEYKIINAFNINDDEKFDKYNINRSRNDQAYFLYLFTAFESATNAAFTQLIRTRRVGLWQDTRAWLSFSINDDEIRKTYFMNKVALLLEKGRTDYNHVKEFYSGRNTIAHGESFEIPFAIPAVAQRMKDIASAFQLC